MFFGLTDVGKKREITEDYFITYKINNNVNIYIVADGLGGYKAGEVASKMAVENILEYVKDKFDNINLLKNKDSYIKTILKTAVKKVNEKIYIKEKTDEKYKGMGTTIVLVLQIKDDIYYLSVGDSRIYYINENLTQIKRITDDDTYVNSLLKKNIITVEEAKKHTQKHVLTKAIGVFDNIDIIVNKFNENIGYILMCTDGVTNMIKDEELLELFKKKDDIKKITNKIITTANENGGTDNITAVVIELNKEKI